MEQVWGEGEGEGEGRGELGFTIHIAKKVKSAC